jgi:predicted TIM-barrel fold metal-dependent hydrolase
MRELAGRGVRGFRIHPGQQPVERWISSPGMKAMWKLGADVNLAMCALVNPEALPALDRMCGQHPDTPVVIDHFGRIGIDGTIRDADLANLVRLARHKRVKVKVSAYYALGKKTAPYTDLAPMIRRLLDVYGPQRLMWASDAPFQVQPPHNYRASIDLVREKLDFLTAEDREWLLRKTAEQTFFAS